MSEYKDFEAFKAAVITEYKKRYSLSHVFSRFVIRTILGGLATLADGILGGRLVGHVAGSTTPDLSEFMFNSFLDDNYKKRFDANVNNDAKLKNLVKEAVEQLIKKTK